MLSAYLDFIDIANFIFLGSETEAGHPIPLQRAGEGYGEREGKGREDIMGDRPSNDISRTNGQEISVQMQP